MILEKTVSLKMEHPKSLFWMVDEQISYPPKKESNRVMLIFAQQNINFMPKEFKKLKLNFGIVFTTGCASVSTHFESIAILNGYIPRPNSDIFIQMFNTADHSVLIREGDVLCKVIYHL